MGRNNPKEIYMARKKKFSGLFKVSGLIVEYVDGEAIKIYDTDHPKRQGLVLMNPSSQSGFSMGKNIDLGILQRMRYPIWYDFLSD